MEMYAKIYGIAYAYGPELYWIMEIALIVKQNNQNR